MTRSRWWSSASRLSAISVVGVGGTFSGSPISPDSAGAIRGTLLLTSRISLAGEARGAGASPSASSASFMRGSIHPKYTCRSRSMRAACALCALPSRMRRASFYSL